MFDFSRRVRAGGMAALPMLLALAGCGGSGGSEGGDGNQAAPVGVAVSVGAEGGTVDGPDGVKVVIPAGALDGPTEIGIARRAVGAPATLPEDYTATAATPIYEFTPHDLVFNKPVTIRVPTSSTASAAEVLMASPGEDWQVADATVSGGFAEWQRNSFSWGFAPFACAPSNSPPYSSGNPDPYPCSLPKGYASASATPATAITQVVAGTTDVFSGSAGSWTVNQASTVRLRINYQTAPDCQNPRAKLLRINPAVPVGTPGRVQTLFDAPVGLTPTTLNRPLADGGGTYVRGVGSTSHDVAFSHLDNGTSAFGYSFSCNRPFRPARTGGDLLTFITSIPVPTATYTIGGTVGGLAAAGLVLQNNGGGDLPVAADGAFSFPTPVASGAPYAVTVLTQPAGQTCTVQNGSGAANAAVSNVAVSCTAANATKAWQGEGLLETLESGDAAQPQVVFSGNGDGMAIWSQRDGTASRILSRPYTPGGGWGPVVPVDNDGTVTAFGPKLAADGRGNIMAVWLQPITPTTTGIWTNRYSPASGWGTATLVKDNVSSVGGNEPEIALDPAGNATVVWIEFDGTWTNLWARRYAANGAGDVATLIEDDNTGGAASHRVVMDAGGNTLVVWVQTDGIRSNRYIVGSGWGTASGLVGSSVTARNLDIALDDVGNATLVWMQTDPPNPRTVYTSFYSGGVWGTPTQVPAGANFVESPSVAMSGNGNAVVVWSEGVSDVFNAWARRYVAGVGEAAVRIDAPTMRASGSSQVAMDAAGNAIVVWNHAFSIWANRYVAGSGWAGATQIDSRPAGGDSLDPRVAVDADGNAIAVWPNTGGLAPTSIWTNVFK